MMFDFDTLPAPERYKLLTGVITPRPIALVTTVDDAGVVNAAPFSFFNCMGADPPVVAIGVGNRGPGVPKDTAANIQRTGQFVVNVVTDDIVGPMNITATEYPPGVDELKAAGLTAVPSVKIAPPRIAESPVNLECKLVQEIVIGRNRIILGQVVAMHVADRFVDGERFHILDGLHTIGRMQSPSRYCRTHDQFDLPRIPFRA